MNRAWINTAHFFRPATRRARALAMTLVVAQALTACSGDDSSPMVRASDARPAHEESVVSNTFETAAREAEKSRNYDAAASYYARLLQERPDDANLLIAVSRNLRYAGSSKNAVNIMKLEMANHGDNADVALEYGKALLAAGEERKAIGQLTQAAAMAPQSWQALSALGVAHDSVSSYERAQQTYRRALELDPDNAVILNNLAMSLAQDGKIRDAITTLERAAVLNRSNVQIRQNLALLYGIRGDAEKARSLAEMDLDPVEVESNVTFYRRFEDQ